MTTQTKTAEKLNDQMTKQIDQVVTLANKGYAQAEKVADFWMTQSLDATKEAQKLSKEWMGTAKSLGDELFKAYQTQVKETMKLFTPVS